MANKPWFYALLGSLTLSLFMLSGCSSSRQRQEETEKQSQTEAEIVLPESETEIQATPTPIPSPSPSPSPTPTPEPELNLKDIQVSVLETGRAGTENIIISENSGETSVSYSFESKKNAFHASSDDSDDELYTSQSGCFYKNTSGWKQFESDPTDVWALVYSEEAKKEESVEINNIPCYHISVQDTEMPGSLMAVCYLNGFTEVISANAEYDFYISKEDSKIIQMEASIPFQGTKNLESSDAWLKATFDVSEDEVKDVADPVSGIVLQKEVSKDYTPGKIFEDQNLYQNKRFDIQIKGNDVFKFDNAKTQEQKDLYEKGGSSYLEEAYGEGDETYVNISSVNTGDNQLDQTAEKYLSDGSAVDIMKQDNRLIGKMEYYVYDAIIGNIQARTYMAKSGKTVLIVSVYSNDPDKINEFDQNLYGFEEDVDWTPSSWIIGSKYTIKAPKGYTISDETSSEFNANMTSIYGSIDVFALGSLTVEEEIQKELKSENGISREEIAEEDIVLSDGNTMKYMVIKETTEDKPDYYAYVGVFIKGTDLIKIYSLNPAENDAMKKAFETIADTIEITEKIPQEKETI